MSFTNSTPNYGLPQWIAADKPKFLTDINNAYSTIDTQIKNANDTATTADGNATSALSIAGQAATTAEGAATVAGQAAALAQSVNELVGTLNAKIGTTSIATIGDGTVTGAISAINNNLTDKVSYHKFDESHANVLESTSSYPVTYTPSNDGILVCQRLIPVSGEVATISIDGTNILTTANAVELGGIIVPIKSGSQIVFNNFVTNSRAIFI